MKKNIRFIALLVFCVTIIGLAIHAGEHHTVCRECQLALKQQVDSTAE